jgi:hypothetical protein
MAHHARPAFAAGRRAPRRPDPDHDLALHLSPVATDSFIARATGEPSRRLMLAVLADAVATFRRTAQACTRRDALIFAETAHWFASDDETEPFAFLTVCDALGLDAEYLRKGLKAIRARAREARHAPAIH